jgi:hypothetical protein
MRSGRHGWWEVSSFYLADLLSSYQPKEGILSKQTPLPIMGATY